MKFLKTTEPGSCCLIRTACKTFASGGYDKSKLLYVAFRLHVRLSEGKAAASINTSQKKRINILFSNAAMFSFYEAKMISFLDQYGANNAQQKAVKHDLRTSDYIAGVKAIGLQCIFVTIQPFPRLVPVGKQMKVNILDINAKYTQLCEISGNAPINLDSL